MGNIRPDSGTTQTKIHCDNEDLKLKVIPTKLMYNVLFEALCKLDVYIYSVVVISTLKISNLSRLLNGVTPNSFGSI